MPYKLNHTLEIILCTNEEFYDFEKNECISILEQYAYRYQIGGIIYITIAFDGKDENNLFTVIVKDLKNNIIKYSDNYKTYQEAYNLAIQIKLIVDDIYQREKESYIMYDKDHFNPW